MKLDKDSINFKEHRICPSCGKIIKISHNFCKFCGVNLSKIEPIGNSDKMIKELALKAINHPDPEVRKKAVDKLGKSKDIKVLGVLTYIFLNDPNDAVRKEAIDELGDIHHPYSLNALSFALKDSSLKVRNEAIEGLKKLKKKITSTNLK
ncbi:MAG: HEAT repeat domain-containing protein [Promethearchaeota archaeon]